MDLGEKMTGTILRFSLLVSCLILFATSGAGAVAWKPLGYGSLNGLEKFSVFVDTDSIHHEHGKVRFWQGHVFYSEQALLSGKTYVRVSIERVVDCAANTDSTLEAIFYGTDGSIVDRYSAEGDARFNTVTPSSISGAVYNFICGLKKTGHQGGKDDQ